MFSVVGDFGIWLRQRRATGIFDFPDCKGSSIIQLGSGPTIEQYFSFKNDVQWKTEKKAEGLYVVTMTDSIGNYGDREVNVKTGLILWPRIGLMSDAMKDPLL